MVVHSMGRISFLVVTVSALVVAMMMFVSPAGAQAQGFCRSPVEVIGPVGTLGPSVDPGYIGPLGPTEQIEAGRTFIPDDAPLCYDPKNVTGAVGTPVPIEPEFGQEQQLNPNELQDKIVQDTLQDTNTLQDTLQGVQTGYRYSEGCLGFNGKRTCLSEGQIKETRDKCIATAVFTFGLSLLHEDCQKVFDYRITWG